MISEVRFEHASVPHLIHCICQRPGWKSGGKDNKRGRAPSTSESDAGSDIEWPQQTDLVYSKSSVGIRTQRPHIRDIGYHLMDNILEDVIFVDAFPRADTRFARYRALVIRAIDSAQKANDLEIYDVIRDRAMQDTQYTRGFISMVCSSFVYIHPSSY